MLGILPYAVGELGRLKDIDINIKLLSKHFGQAGLSMENSDDWTLYEWEDIIKLAS